MTIRRAASKDLAAITELYNHYIVSSPATFDLEPFAVADREAWFSGFAESGPCQLLLAEDGDNLIGFACATPLRPKAAYRRSVETTIYLAPDQVGRGTGSALYTALLDVLNEAGVHRAYSLITIPNAASVRLHEKFGYRLAGHMTECGWKFERWWDVHWYERRF
ncbi:MAG: N-acetyltransferase [Gammaproteobacteria bacterium]|nr:N-acetyltransferase [Gammaproteobacteria bacterium]